MARIIFLFIVVLICSINSSAQIRLMVGANLGRYNYLESPQANMAAQFNLGYDYAYNGETNTPSFSASKNQYDVKNELHWNQTTTGITLGFQFDTDGKFNHALFYESRKNSGSGSRVNITQNYEEKMSMTSKFGGIYYSANYHLKSRLGIFYKIGFTRYRIKCDIESPNGEMKNATLGYQIKVFSSSLKPGDKPLNLVNALGIDFALIQNDKLEVSLRPEIGFAFNSMSEINLGPLYLDWIFNLNYLQCGLLIKPRISK